MKCKYLLDNFTCGYPRLVCEDWITWSQTVENFEKEIYEYCLNLKEEKK
jgi:hypothetical protein